MPWESGPRGRPYYTRTRRENGRVIREYIGVGREGRQAAQEDEARRRQVEADREAERALAEEIRCGRRPGRRGGLLPGHHGTWGGTFSSI